MIKDGQESYKRLNKDHNKLKRDLKTKKDELEITKKQLKILRSKNNTNKNNNYDPDAQEKLLKQRDKRIRELQNKLVNYRGNDIENDLKIKKLEKDLREKNEEVEEQQDNYWKLDKKLNDTKDKLIQQSKNYNDLTREKNDLYWEHERLKKEYKHIEDNYNDEKLYHNSTRNNYENEKRYHKQTLQNYNREKNDHNRTQQLLQNEKKKSTNAKRNYDNERKNHNNTKRQLRDAKSRIDSLTKNKKEISDEIKKRREEFEKVAFELSRKKEEYENMEKEKSMLSEEIQQTKLDHNRELKDTKNHDFVQLNKLKEKNKKLQKQITNLQDLISELNPEHETTDSKFPSNTDIANKYDQDLKTEKHLQISKKLIKILKTEVDWDGKKNEIWCKQFVYHLLFDIITESYNTLKDYYGTIFNGFYQRLCSDDTDTRLESIANQVKKYMKDNYERIIEKKFDELYDDILQKVRRHQYVQSNKLLQQINEIFKSEDTTLEEELIEYVKLCCMLCWMCILDDGNIELYPKVFRPEKDIKFNKKEHENQKVKAFKKLDEKKKKIGYIAYYVFPRLQYNTGPLKESRIYCVQDYYDIDCHNWLHDNDDIVEVELEVEEKEEVEEENKVENSIENTDNKNEKNDKTLVETQDIFEDEDNYNLPDDNGQSSTRKNTGSINEVQEENNELDDKKNESDEENEVTFVTRNDDDKGSNIDYGESKEDTNEEVVDENKEIEFKKATSFMIRSNIHVYDANEAFTVQVTATTLILKIKLKENKTPLKITVKRKPKAFRYVKTLSVGNGRPGVEFKGCSKTTISEVTWSLSYNKKSIANAKDLVKELNNLCI